MPASYESIHSDPPRINGTKLFPPLRSVRVKKILVAEGEPEVRDLLADELEVEGYAVEVVKNGLDALSRLYFEDFDAVVASWKLPVRDGLVVAGAVREMQHGTPVILLTEPENDAWVRKQVARLGAICLSKPFSFKRLRELLRFVVGQ